MADNIASGKITILEIIVCSTEREPSWLDAFAEDFKAAACAVYLQAIASIIKDPGTPEQLQRRKRLRASI